MNYIILRRILVSHHSGISIWAMLMPACWRISSYQSLPACFTSQIISLVVQKWSCFIDGWGTRGGGLGVGLNVGQYIMYIILRATSSICTPNLINMKFFFFYHPYINTHTHTALCDQALTSLIFSFVVQLSLIRLKTGVRLQLLPFLDSAFRSQPNPCFQSKMSYILSRNCD